MPRKTNYNIYGTGKTSGKANTDYNKEVKTASNKLTKAKAKPLNTPNITFLVNASVINIPKGVEGKLEMTAESTENFEACEAQAKEALRYDVAFNQYKIQATYAITAKQKEALHPVKKSSKPAGPLSIETYGQPQKFVL